MRAIARSVAGATAFAAVGGCAGRDLVTAPVLGRASATALRTTAESDAVRVVTFGDSNTDQGYSDGTVSARVRSYVSRAPIALTPTAPHDPRQLAGKIERRWRERRLEALVAVNHGITATTTGTGRTSYGSPSARTEVGGVTRFEAEVLGAGAPAWQGGEPVNASYPNGPVTRANARAADARTVAYLSMGTNDARQGWSVATTAGNLRWMVERWLAAGRRADHLVVTTLAPVDVSTHAWRVAAINGSVRALAARTGVHVVDLAAHVSADNGRTWRSDTLHQGDRLHYRSGVREWLAEQVVTHVARLHPQASPAAGQHAPVAAFAASGSAVEGAALAFDASASTDADGDALTYDWTFGDGTAATGRTATHAYADNGRYAVTLTVRDALGHYGRTTRTVDVANAAPVVVAGRDTTVIAGRSVTYGGASFTDAGGADSTWRHTIDWGDGSASSSTTVRRQGALPRLGKNFSAAGTYVVRRQVRDKDGTTGSRTFVVTVRPNAVPTASAGGPYTGRAGTSLRFTGAGSSDPDGDALRYRWEFGDGTTSTSTSPYKRYGSSGTYVVRLVVTDPSGAKDTASTMATIAAAY